jgi:transcriptional regulator with XRE-family HTH domain
MEAAGIVGVYVRTLRERRSITQIELAQALKLSERTIRNLELGKHSMRLADLQRVFRAIGGSWEHITILMNGHTSPAQAAELASRVVLTEDQYATLAELPADEKNLLFQMADQFLKRRS